MLSFGARARVVLAGDYNVIPTDRDVYKPERWKKDALFSPEAKAKFAELVAQGWTDAIRIRLTAPLANYAVAFAIFTVIFGRFAKLPSDGSPYLLEDGGLFVDLDVQALAL